MANSNKKINLSIIIPVFNSSKILKKLTNQIKKNLNFKLSKIQLLIYKSFGVNKKEKKIIKTKKKNK